jgi:methylglutamate dehydrogenase subunit D
VPDLNIIASMDGVGVASVLARKGVAGEALMQRFGAEGPVRWRDGRCTFLGVGPGHWLALQEAGQSCLIAALRERLGNTAWIVDQSGAYRVFKIAGPDARLLLQRAVAIDLHPDAFGPNAAASTSIALMTAVLWRLQGPDAFAVAIFRSYEASFRRWIDQALAAL